MASIFGSSSGAEPVSGGKIVRTRRTVVRKTPYDRPKLPIADPQSPNWVSRYIVSPTRSIASGAGKLLSFVIDRESSPSSSSSYSSTCDADSSSEDEIDTEDQENVENGQEDSRLNKKNWTVEAVNYRKEPLRSYGKTKITIEQLLMQETFSREEAESLVKTIRARVGDSPINESAANKGAGTSTPELSSTAVMEARKWLQERKLRSESRLDPGDASYTWNSNIPPEVLGDGGSPADLAKTYMRTRPPWASPVDRVSSPSSIGIHLFKEDTPCSTSDKPFSFSKTRCKRDYSATGSWNIQDEIRRVRSRATEEMLRNVPSSKLDYSASALEHKNSTGSPTAGRLESKQEENVQNTTSVADAFFNLTGEQNVLTFPDLKRKYQMKNGAALASEAIFCPGENQDLVAGQTSKEKTSSGQFGSTDEVKILLHRDDNLGNAGAVNTTSGTTQLLNPIANEVAEDWKLNDENCFTTSKVIGSEGAVPNCCPSSVSSLYAGQHLEQNEVACHEDRSLCSSRDMTGKVVPPAQYETCELMSETLMEIPECNVNSNVAVNGDDGDASGSQNSSSVPYEELRKISEKSSATKTNTIERRRGKRLSKYNRKRKGRGK